MRMIIDNWVGLAYDKPRDRGPYLSHMEVIYGCKTAQGSG